MGHPDRRRLRIGRYGLMYSALFGARVGWDVFAIR
jgi:hypothetical protein